PSQADVIAVGQRRGEDETGCVETIPQGEVVRRWIEPQVFEDFRIDAQHTLVERLDRILVESLNRAARVAEPHNAGFEGVGRDYARHGGGVRIAASFIVEEEEGLVLEDRPADGAAETVVEQKRTFDAEPVVRPRIGGERSILMVVIGAAMPLVAAALGDQHDLTASGTPEGGVGVSRSSPELFDGVNRHRDDGPEG